MTSTMTIKLKSPPHLNLLFRLRVDLLLLNYFAQTAFKKSCLQRS